jgi:NADH dehydrogenase (ubiquinone) 1 beta subcomplex subunit 11
MIMFGTVTLGLVGTGFLLAYWPDHRLRDWAQREAYIEIARREALGLPHIDPNLVPPEKINLPTEEELGDFEVII